MVHTVFGLEEEEEVSQPVQTKAARQQVAASPSNLSREDQDGATAIFKKKKDRKRKAEESNGVDRTQGGTQAGPSQPSPAVASKKPRVTIFHDDTDEEDEDEEAGTSFRQPKTASGSNGADLSSKKESKLRERIQRKERAQQLLSLRMKLPVWFGKEKILEEIDREDTVVVLGETGCGKTTRRLETFLEGKYNLLILATDGVQKYHSSCWTARSVETGLASPSLSLVEWQRHL